MSEDDDDDEDGDDDDVRPRRRASSARRVSGRRRRRSAARADGTTVADDDARPTRRHVLPVLIYAFSTETHKVCEAHYRPFRFDTRPVCMFDHVPLLAILGLAWRYSCFGCINPILLIMSAFL